MVLLTLSERMDKIETEHRLLMQHFAEHTSLSAEATEDLKDIADIVRAAKIGLLFLAKLATIAKWISAVGGAIAIVWGLIWTYKHGGKPPEMP